MTRLINNSGIFKKSVNPETYERCTRKCLDESGKGFDLTISLELVAFCLGYPLDL
jgi:hypothetical protein